MGVDRIEIASTRVSEGERKAARLVARWARGAGYLERVEILGYCDGRASVDWIAGIGGRVMNLLTKGSERHCRSQLGMEPAEHRAARRGDDPPRPPAQAGRERLPRGLVERRRAILRLRVRDGEAAARARVERIYLPDTLGIFSPPT